jgi:hypothetical protein
VVLYSPDRKSGSKPAIAIAFLMCREKNPRRSTAMPCSGGVAKSFALLGHHPRKRRIARISRATRELIGGYRANKSTMAIVNSPVAAINTLWPQRAICPSIISIS